MIEVKKDLRIPYRLTGCGTYHPKTNSSKRKTCHLNVEVMNSLEDNREDGEGKVDNAEDQSAPVRRCESRHL